MFREMPSESMFHYFVAHFGSLAGLVGSEMRARTEKYMQMPLQVPDFFDKMLVVCRYAVLFGRPDANFIACRLPDRMHVGLFFSDS